MNDKAIQLATGVSPSTFHRWQAGDFRTAPELEKVERFCRGLGADPDEAAAALGLTRRRDTPAPEPQLPREVVVILRALADPATPPAEKAVIREMLLMLAERADQAGRKRRGGRAGEAG